MNYTITIKSSQFIQNLLESLPINSKDNLFNSVTSHIIKDFNSPISLKTYKNNSIMKCNFLYNNSNLYYYINVNDYNYIGKLHSNEMNLDIVTTY